MRVVVKDAHGNTMWFVCQQWFGGREGTRNPALGDTAAGFNLLTLTAKGTLQDGINPPGKAKSQALKRTLSPALSTQQPPW